MLALYDGIELYFAPWEHPEVFGRVLYQGKVGLITANGSLFMEAYHTHD